ncbi:MAG: hypothetical protein WBD20_25930 [Pirellulaceae bacterium]
MTRSSDELRLIYLSGTVSIPPRFPDVAQITFESGPSRDTPLIVATHRISPKLVIKRIFFSCDVSAIFQPTADAPVDLENGRWFQGEDLQFKAEDEIGQPAIEGIVYVRENAQSILEMQAGLTAAESAEYYPPLPDDRSVNHYSMSKDNAGGCY